MNALSPRRYLSLWLRRLSTDRLERRPSTPAEHPRVVAAPVKGAQRIAALNDAAAALGLREGMPVADACAMRPMLAVIEHDPHADAALLEALADACDRYTPLVGLDPPDGLTLDIAGCAHLFGGEAPLAADLMQRLAKHGFSSRIGIADTFGCAHAAARFIASAVRPAVTVPPGGQIVALSSLPLAALRIDAKSVADLKTMGFRRIADLMTQPRAPFTARFGAILLQRLDQATGARDAPISPRLPVSAAMAEQPFPEPIGREDDVLGTVESLAGKLDMIMSHRGEGARLIALALFRTDGMVHRLEIGTGAPLRDPRRIRALFAERLTALGDACDPGFGYDLIRLSARVTERCDPHQTGLAAPDHAAELTHLVDRLGARFGLRRVSRLVPRDTHIPEFAVAMVPAHAIGWDQPAFIRPEAVFPYSLFQDSLGMVRPVRLFARPEPVEATAEVPDGAPARFRWRRVWHGVIHAEGPERIAMEWWRSTGHAPERDYFRIETATGVRLWLFREGLYDRPQSAPPRLPPDPRDQGEPQPLEPRWYLQGLCA